MSFLQTLETIIRDRQSNPVEGSYTASLFASGRARIAQKVGEEGVETVIAALTQGRDRQTAEIADLFYHTLVLLADLGLSLADVEHELERRHSPRARPTE
jgi:phosphoribosyl-ATP pyrophosphohydrolase